ncbi:MAG: helicase [Rhodospirillales bacterium]|nr:helicase [Rhodospirillales bacterium]
MPFPSIPPNLLRALSERGYAEPTPVQAAVLQPEAAGKDLLVSAQTGSGKTIAFGLAIAPTLLGDNERFGSGPAQPLALVVAPTRELALQVERELGWLYAYTGARIASCVGGMDIRGEQRMLRQGAHIVVGTPGRLRDHLERGNLATAQMRAVVLDEADEMLDLGFREDLECILGAMPENRRTLLFSATIPKGIAVLAKRFQLDAMRIATTSATEAHGDIEYRGLQIAPHEVERAVVNVLRYFEANGALVFCSTREAVRRLHGNLLERGFAVVALSGELSQTERTRALQALRDGRARVCVATDVAARGLDLPDLGLVIHADLPHDSEVLQHRSGRTGRAGRKGIAVLLVPHTRRRTVERLAAGAHVKLAWGQPPSAEEIRSRDQDRLVAEAIQAAAEPTEEDLAAARLLLAEHSPELLAAALIRSLRTRMPAPEELSGGGPGTPPPPRAARDGRDAPSDSGPTPGFPTDVVWFRINVGRRSGNADPRWLLPFICRRGQVTRGDVGKIQISDRETRFGIAANVAAKFATAARRADGKDAEIHIQAIAEDEQAKYRPKNRPHSAGKR